MKKAPLFILIAIAAALFAGCGAPAANTPANTNANTNTNTAKPVAAAPTADVLLAMDKAANEAFIKGDAKHFEEMLSDKFTSFEMGHRMSKAEMLKMVGGMKCDVKTWSLDDPQMAMINADTYVVSYKGTFDGTCAGPDGKSMKLPSPIRAASVWVRSGEKWHGAFHGENMIIDPKATPAAPAKPEAKKADAKKEEPKKDDKAPANAATAETKAAPSANTEALVKLHTAGWEAFKARDAKKFDEMLSANFSMVDPIGGWMAGKANAIKQWTETMKCEGVTKVSVSDGFATAISPTVELLTLKGTADGSCDGQKNGAIYQSAIYVKEGEAWKLAFMFESAGV